MFTTAHGASGTAALERAQVAQASPRSSPGTRTVRGRTGDWRSIFNMADAFVQDIVSKVRGILSPVGLESYPFKVSIFFNKPHNTFIRGCFVDGVFES